MAIIGLMVLAGLFVVVVGFWAVTLDGGREAEPEVQPTPTLGERPQNWLRVLVQNEAGEPFAAALVEFPRPARSGRGYAAYGSRRDAPRRW